MKETRQIRYRSIIDHGNNQKISDHYEGNALYEITMTYESYQFKHPTYGMMTIKLQNNHVTLSYQNTKLEMIKDKKHSILYATPYGEMNLEVYLKKCDRQPNHLHLVYYLYDQNEILSKCYLMIDEINLILS